MQVLAINPNSTASMTEAIATQVNGVLGAAGTCIGLTNTGAPPAIQGPEDGAKAVPGVLELIQDNKADAYIIACFDDTGLEEARKVAGAPVLGIGQASYHMASLLRPGFAVVTTLDVSVPVIADNIARGHFGPACRGVLASNVPVLALEQNPAAAGKEISARIARIEAEHPGCAVILGCAGMSGLHRELAEKHSALLLDPVDCAARLVAPLIASGG